MRDPGYQLQKSYYEALLNNVTFNGVAVPVVDELSYDDKLPVQIVLSSQTDSDASDKNCNSHDITMVLEIVKRFTDGGGKEDVFKIADQCLQIVYPQHYHLQVSGFNIYTTRLIGADSLVETTTTDKVYRRILRLRHLMSEIENGNDVIINPAGQNLIFETVDESATLSEVLVINTPSGKKYIPTIEKIR